MPSRIAKLYAAGVLGGLPSWVMAGAYLDADFAGGRSYGPASGYNNVNSTGGSVLSSAGVLSTIGANLKRTASGTGLDIKPSTSNLGFPSEQAALFFNSATNCSIANSSTVGPDGVSTTFYSTATTTSAGGSRQRNTAIANDNGVYRGSIFVAAKSGGQTVRFLLGLAGGSGVTSPFVDFNITTGAIVANPSGLGTVQAVSGGWRVSTTVTNNSSGYTTLFALFYPAGSSGSGSADFGGYLLVKQSLLSDYIPTTTGAVAQSADVVTRTAGSDLAAAAGRFTVTAHTAVGAGTQVLWQRDDGSANNRLTIYRDSSRFIHFVVVSGGVTYSDRTIALVPDDTDLTASIAWSGTLASYTLNAGTPFLEAAVTMPVGITTERLGCDTSGNQWGGYIKRATAFLNAGIVAPSFYDSFNRSNTSPGVMSNPPVGNAYGFYGPGSDPLPAATNGYISAKGFIEDQNNTSYLEQNLGAPVWSASAKLSWTPAGGSTGDGNFAFLIFNTSGSIATCIHIQVGRTQAVIQKRVAGAFTTLATLSYPATLAANGTINDASLTISGSTVSLTVNGVSAQATDAFFATSDGNFIIYENTMVDAVSALKIQAVTAN